MVGVNGRKTFVVNALGLDSGGGRVVGMNLCRALAKVDAENQYVFVFPEACGYENVALAANQEARLVRVRPKSLRRPLLDHVWLPRLCRAVGADVLFSMSNFGPRHVDCAHVLGIHTPYLFYPDSPVWARFPRVKRWMVRSQTPYFRWASRGVARFCVLTPVVGGRLHRLFGVPDSRIRVIPNSVSEDMFGEPVVSREIAERLAPHRDRFKLCYVAPFYPHKNHQVLLDMLRVLRGTPDGADVVCVVTVDGACSPLARELLDTVRREGLDSSLVNVGMRPVADLPYLYTSCDALIMPTLLECYSQTYVEAMHFGLPIVTADMDFARTVCGDAALYCDPLDAGDLARAVLKLRDEPALRQTLVARARRRLASIVISWEDVARRYLMVLQDASRLNGEGGS